MPDLNRRQFEQPELAGMPSPALGPHRRDQGSAPSSGDVPYDTAHKMGEWEANPLAPGASDRGLGVVATSGRGYEQTEEFVPSWRIVSPQASVSREAVDHIKENANLLDLKSDPTFNAKEGTRDDSESMRSALAESHGERYTSIMDEPEIYHLTDGNHRVNAALEKGQLLIPGKVTRF